MGTTHLASWQKDREDWLGAGFHLLVASPAETTQDASWQKDREDWLGADFHLLVAKEFENKKTSNKSFFLNRKTLHLHNVRCGGVPLGQLLREAEASAVANRAPISLGRHKKQVTCFLLLSAFITFETQLKLLWK